MQLHVEGEKLRCYTRTGTDFTSLYKPFFDKIDIRSLIEAKSCILDGEIVSWNPELKRFGDFPLHTTIATSMGGVRSRHDLTLEGLDLSPPLSTPQRSGRAFLGQGERVQTNVVRERGVNRVSEERKRGRLTRALS